MRKNEINSQKQPIKLRRSYVKRLKKTRKNSNGDTGNTKTSRRRKEWRNNNIKRSERIKNQWSAILTRKEDIAKNDAEAFTSQVTANTENKLREELMSTDIKYRDST